MKKKIFKPLVSIIINCYNGEKYLKKSIQSILSQTYSNWEIIFFDNNSDDSSKKIVKKFSDNRIKYFYSKKTHSLYKARNIAISKSKGEYICFLDTDDIWLKDKLKIQLMYFKSNKNTVLKRFFFKNCFCFSIHPNAGVSYSHKQKAINN